MTRYMPPKFKIYGPDAVDMVNTFYAAIKESYSAGAPTADSDNG
jgi:hypothetical protein